MLYFPYDIYMNIKKITANNLRKLLEEKGISQNKLADDLGIQPPYVNALVKGKRGIGQKILPKLCEKLEIRPYQFFIEDIDILSKAPEKYTTAERVYIEKLIVIFRDKQSEKLSNLIKNQIETVFRELTPKGKIKRAKKCIRNMESQEQFKKIMRR